MSNVPTAIRHALRMLWKAPGASATVVLALALGIGLPTLMLALIEGTLRTSLPSEGGDRVVRISSAEEVSVEDYVGWRERQRSFERLGTVSTGTVSLAVEGRGAVPLAAASLDADVLPLLSVQPALGRSFDASEHQVDGSAVALVGHRVWLEEMGSDPDAVGSVVRVDGRPTQVVGVMPEGFGFPYNAQVWMPLAVDELRPELAGEMGGPIGLLREGVSPSQAAEDLTRLTREMQTARGGSTDDGSQISVVPYTDLFSQPGASATLAALMLGLALMVLLVACANVANVLLARTVARSREVAIRAAMGASRLRIGRQLLGEIAVLAAVGAGAGLLLGGTAVRIAREIMVGSPEAPYWIDVRVDPSVVVFVVVLAAGAALAAGLIPALQASRADPHELLKDGGRGGSGFHLGRIMRRLIAVEIAVSFVLLVGAGLFIRSAVNFYRFDFAFEPEGVYAARFTIPEITYGTLDERASFLEVLEQSLLSLPEVEAVALSTALPGVGSTDVEEVELEGRPPLAGAEASRVRSVAVTPRFFDLFRATVRGRAFDGGDVAGAVPVAVVNPAFERAHFPEGALGRQLRLTSESGQGEWLTIVGVTSDLLAGGVDAEMEETVYLPVAQEAPAGAIVLARPTTEFASLPPTIREAMSTLDSDVPLFNVRELRESIDLANAQYRWMGTLFLTAGSIALLLAVIGLYGVMSFWVAQRTREIGVRMAVGGRKSQVVGLVLRQGMIQTSLGLAVGLALAVPSARLLRVALFQVSPVDPVVFVSIAGALTAAALLGCWVPVLRATRVDPTVALGSE